MTLATIEGLLAEGSCQIVYVEMKYNINISQYQNLTGVLLSDTCTYTQILSLHQHENIRLTSLSGLML